MKKITILAVAALAISFASCKKDRTCECTQTSTVLGTTYTTVSSTVVKSGKKDAESWCAASNGSKTTVTVNGTAQSSSTSNASCAIK